MTKFKLKYDLYKRDHKNQLRLKLFCLLIYHTFSSTYFFIHSTPKIRICSLASKNFNHRSYYSSMSKKNYINMEVFLPSYKRRK